MALVNEQELIEAHQGLVRTIASKVARMTSSSTDLEDLVAFGQQGLVEAAKRYDPERGVAFGTFAYYRIRGAVFDGLRKIHFSGRRGRRLAFEERADAYLEQVGTEPVPPTATAAAERLANVMADLAVAYIACSDQIDTTQDKSTPDPATVAERREMLRLVREGMSRLPDKERELIELMYFSGKGLVEAGEELGLSKGWASRLHARAIAQLRRQSSDDPPDERPPPPHAIRV